MSGSVRRCLVASDATGLRDVLVGVDREPAVLGITVAQIEHERSQAARYREALERIMRDEPIGAHEVPVPLDVLVAELRAIAREALERITAAHVAGASAGELADRARGVLRGGGGHDD